MKIRIRQRQRESLRCPRCLSRDVWRWEKDGWLGRFLGRYLPFGLVSCRGCGKAFYAFNPPPVAVPPGK